MEHIYHSIIRDYLRHGFAPIPVKFRSKEPIYKAWTDLRVGESEIEEYFNDVPINIGILTGRPSAGLVDVDIDHHKSLKFAQYFLPKTNCVFGHASKPRSHWLYRVPDAATVKAYAAAGMIIEVRGNGRYTVFPGSMHESGETIEFDNADDYAPGKSTWAELIRAASQIAIATVLYPCWSQHSHTRHALALAVAAFLTRRGWKHEDVTTLIEAIAKEANDEELEDRLRCVDDTFAAYAHGNSISGDEELAKSIGPELAQRIEKWVSGKASKKNEKTTSGTSSPQGNGSVDISTDAAAADAFANAFKHRLVYCNGQWFYRQVQVLEPVTTESVQGLAKGFFQDQVAKFAAGPLAYSPLKSLLSRARINATIELSRSSFYVDPASIDKDINLLGLADGNVFDLNTRNTLAIGQPLVTRKVGATLDPAVRCPLWERFLDEIVQGNGEVIQFVQRAVGYSLSGWVSEQCLFILIGTGANGKSTFLKVLQTVFGGYAGTVPMTTLMEQRFGSQQTNDLAYLAGKRFVVGSEGERGQKLAEGKIKLMTGGDRIVCRSMYKDYFEFDPQFKLWLATNDLPTISGTDEAIWRRIYVIEFPVSFAPDQQDKTLGDRLIQEVAGIFNWAYEGYREWKEQGLNPPPMVLQSTRSYRKDNDSVGQWIEAACVVEPGAESTMKDLYQSYLGWCGNSGMDPLPNGRFGKELTRRGYKSVKGREGNARRGIALTAAFDPTSPDPYVRMSSTLRKLEGGMRPN